MKQSVYLRALVLEDAKVSYKWRNDAEIWKFTKYNSAQIITPEMETEWLEGILQRDNERRFAICTIDQNQFIGYIYFADILNDTASAHVVIGEKEFWGKGIASELSVLFLSYGLSAMGLNRINLEVSRSNVHMIDFYTRLGFKMIGQSTDFFKMTMVKDEFTRYDEDIASDTVTIFR